MKVRSTGFLLVLGCLLAARASLLWPGRSKGFFWAYVAATLLLNAIMVLRVRPDRDRCHLRGITGRQLLWILPAALAARLLLNPAWPTEALGLPVGILVAGACEEPLFRGFLWGYLRELGWPEALVCAFQAGLFGLGHLYWYFQYADPWIWQRTFAAGLILGLVAWKSRSVVGSALVHGVINM